MLVINAEFDCNVIVAEFERISNAPLSALIVPVKSGSVSHPGNVFASFGIFLEIFLSSLVSVTVLQMCSVQSQVVTCSDYFEGFGPKSKTSREPDVLT